MTMERRWEQSGGEAESNTAAGLKGKGECAPCNRSLF